MRPVFKRPILLASSERFVGISKMKIGFIGLGVMGSPMSGHLSKAGHTLFLHDLDMGLTRKHADALAGDARALATPQDVAEQSDVVITMLPNGKVVQEVALGPKGLIHGMKPGTLLLDTSSAEPWITKDTAQALAAKGVAMVDAPVSGAQWGAQEAKLVFMVGAEAADLARVRPLLEVMGHKIHHLGGLGAGHTMKCINNTITSMTLSATSEGLVIGKQHGLNPSAMVDVLNDSTGGSWISQTHIKQRVINRRFDDPFKLALMLKDIGIAMELSRQAGLSTPMSALGQQLWAAASRAAGPEASVSELVRWVENQSGTQICAPE
jgi:3-hydroxyisobutyrate dehydrogenase-like beta-hydroxyacid dehydrogenase